MTSANEDRFWSHVDRSGECWVWTASRHGGGYGDFRLGDKGRVAAHRHAWELANGPIPDGLWVLHRCDNPSCVRPAHLFLGTNSDNQIDCVEKGRRPSGVHAHGEGHGRSRLTDAAVREARELYRAGIAKRELARRYGVHGRTMADAIDRRTWRHVA